MTTRGTSFVRARHGRQQGLTLVVVLVLLLVMLLGGLSMARMAEVGTLVAGNISVKERALQASDVGLNAAFVRVLALANDNADNGTWYAAKNRDTTSAGLPANVDWAAAPELLTGPNNQFSVRYFVDRQCGDVAVTDLERQCLVRQGTPATKDLSSGKGADDAPLQPAGAQFRITVRVTTASRDSSSANANEVATFVQVLATKPPPGTPIP